MNTVRDMVDQHIKDYFNLIIAISEDMNISLDEVLLQEDILLITPSVMIDFNDDMILELLQFYINVGHDHVQRFDLFEIIKQVQELSLQDSETCILEIDKLYGGQYVC